MFRRRNGRRTGGGTRREGRPFNGPESLEPRRLFAADVYDGLLAPPEAVITPSAEMGGFAYFFARDAATDHSRLYRSDGTPAGTAPTGADLPVPITSNTTASPRYDPQGLTTLGGQILFVAYDANFDAQLWSTDGTPANTRRLFSFDPDTLQPGDFTRAGDQVFFTVDSGSSPINRELWRTDGTAAGTRLVEDIRPGATGSNPFRLTPVKDRLYFVANDGTHGTELWSSDGTAAGTSMVRDIAPGASGTVISAPYADADTGKLYFIAAVGSTRTPWVTDGTEQGTLKLTDARSVADEIARPGFARFGGRVYFAASEAATGFELWSTDGTPSGTALAFETVPGPGGLAIAPIAEVGGRLLFAGNPGQRWSLYATDGTTAGTYALDSALTPRQYEMVGGRLVFSTFTTTSISPPAVGDEMWATDGTIAGTRLLKDIAPNSASSTPGVMGKLGDKLLFFASSPAGGTAPWVTDGTPEGTLPLPAVATVPTPVFAERIAAAGKTLYTFGRYRNRAGFGRALWATDGAGPDAGTPSLPVVYGVNADSANHFLHTTESGRIFFGGFGGIWASDGTPQGTARLSSVLVANYEELGRQPQTAVVGDTLFFVVRPDTRTHELWKSDGTAAGTTRVATIPGGERSYGAIRYLYPVGDKLFFYAFTDAHGFEPWVSDGTAEGTRLLADLQPGGNSSGLTGTWESVLGAPVGNQLYFVADDGTHHNGLFLTDGSSEGTRLVEDLLPGRAAVGDVRFASARAVGDTVYFTYLGLSHDTNSPPSGAVWRTDGTEVGTRIVQDGLSGFAVPLGVYDGGLYFTTAEVSTGSGLLPRTLYRVDGVTEQVVPLKSFPGATLARLRGPVGGPDGVYFVVELGGTAGEELWASDGTPQGTRLVATAATDSAGQGFGGVASTGDHVWYVADDDRLWVTPPLPRPPPTSVVGRHVFYGGSAAEGGADGGAPAAAPDKSALLPGAAATFANVTSYGRGINGLLLDLAGLRHDLSAGDFVFEVGDGAGTWAAAPAPASVRRDRGAGPGGSDRITLAWPDGGVRNAWLRVTVKANDDTGLAAPDVFSFGNLVGETGDGAAGGLRVSALDLAAVKRALNTASPPDGRFDFNRDGRVNALDVAAVRQNLNRFLALPTPPAVASPQTQPEGAGRGEDEERRVVELLA